MTLRFGCKGEDVADLQRRLNAIGWVLAVDGDFGPATTQAVKEFQKARALEVDGIAGPITMQALRDADPKRTSSYPPVRCWPLRELADGRKPHVTSGFRHPLRPDHVGVDMFYPYDAKKDPPMKLGDGGRTSKWWIPDNHVAIACAAGKVTGATWTVTGYHVRIAMESGFAAGYFHLSSLLVAVGQVVTLGQPVGIVGDAPNGHDERHLHFEIYTGHTGWSRVDPETFFRGASILPSLERP